MAHLLRKGWILIYLWLKFVALTKNILQPFKVVSRSAKYLPKVETTWAKYMLNFILLAIFPENFIVIGRDLDMRVASFVKGMPTGFRLCRSNVLVAVIRFDYPVLPRGWFSVIFRTAIWMSETRLGFYWGNNGSHMSIEVGVCRRHSQDISLKIYHVKT